MIFLQVHKYKPSHPILKDLIKYFWVLKNNRSVSVEHKILPVNNIDLILNLSAPISYSFNPNSEEIPETFHFNGIRSRHGVLKQSGRLFVIGISFFPAGLYPLLKIPVSEFADQTVELNLLLPGFTDRVSERLCGNDLFADWLRFLEGELIKYIKISLLPPSEIYRTINLFYYNTMNMGIYKFCERKGINQRKLERDFQKYVGLSPKQFLKLQRFHGALHQLTTNWKTGLASLAYEYGYYDQTHFNKEFKRYTGVSPTQFCEEKKFLKQLLDNW